MDELLARLPLPKRLKTHLEIIYYLLLMLFVLIYVEAEVQPFVYVRF